MANYLDYIRWRGDLTFSQDPPNVVDAMIFANLTYLRLQGRTVEDPNTPLPLSEVAAEFFCLPDWKDRGGVPNDFALLQAAAGSARFGSAGLVRYRSQFVPEEDTQFAAETFLLDDGSIFLAFRGTDNTLVGWKEDFNMSFQQTVPSQRLAQDYVRELYAQYMAPMRLCGHSKGGNLAIFASARSSPMIQGLIQEVYNFDGPGFTDYFMGDPGYLALVPRIHTYVPQSSVIGVLMDREEPLNIVRSNQIGLLQHDISSWEVMGKSLIPVQELTADSCFIKATIQNWLKKMDLEERNRVVEALFALFAYGNVERPTDLLNLKNMRSVLKLYGEDEGIRKVLSGELENLLDAARSSYNAQQTSAEESAVLEQGTAEQK